MFIVCPHCKRYVDASVTTQQTDFSILECVSCGNSCVALDEGRVDEQTKRKVVRVVYTVETPIDDPYTPEEVKRDYKEAVLCHNVGASRATAAMCRRAIQTSTMQKGASKKRLVDQMDELLANNTISPQIAEWAHEIRLWGNIGAYPDDGLEDVSIEDADEIMNFTTEYLEHVYSMPARIEAKKSKR